jgi:hypothetical protein
MKMIKDLGMMYPKEGSKKKRHYAIYECPECGKHFKSMTVSVNCGDTQSCGCKKMELVHKLNRKHGMWKTPLYMAWANIKARCTNPNLPGYSRYGGRGITMCDEWRNDFMAFYKWSMDNGYAEGLEIDRINNDGNYESSNCRWVTCSVNQQNKSKSKQTASGYKGVFAERDKWCARIGAYGKGYYIGSFYSPEEAALAYNEWVITNKTYHVLNDIKPKTKS